MTITTHNNRLSTFFSTFGMDKLEKIHQLCWKSLALKTNKDISSSKLQNFTDVCIWWGQKLALHHTNICKFSQLCGPTSSLT